MKHKIFLALSLIFSINTFAQNPSNNQNTSEGFSITFFFQHKSETNNISISANEENSTFSFLNSDCGPTQRQENISDTYYFNQFKAVLEELDIVTFQPQNNDLDLSSNLRIDVRYFDNLTKEQNAFQFQYNSNLEDNENRILEFLVKVLEDNTTRSCNRDVVQKLKMYLEGEEESEDE